MLNVWQEEEEEGEEAEREQQQYDEAVEKLLREARERQQLVPAAEGGAGGVGGAGGEGMAGGAGAARQETWESRDDFIAPGHAGHTAFVQEMFRRGGVPSNDRIKPPEQLAPCAWVGGPLQEQPRLQPYQETV
eukprot:6355437-Prymnesium_polylepis.1